MSSEANGRFCHHLRHHFPISQPTTACAIEYSPICCCCGWSWASRLPPLPHLRPPPRCGFVGVLPVGRRCAAFVLANGTAVLHLSASERKQDNALSRRLTVNIPCRETISLPRHALFDNFCLWARWANQRYFFLILPFFLL